VQKEERGRVRTSSHLRWTALTDQPQFGSILSSYQLAQLLALRLYPLLGGDCW
jgi:hypothetical protein